MALGNAVDANQQGMQYLSSLGIWSGVDGGPAGQVLTSNGTGVSATFQAVPAGSITVNGDTGSASGSTLNLTGLTTAGKTVSFVASGATITLNTTDAGQNTAIGQQALNSVAGGVLNTAFGFQALKNSVLTFGNTAIGTQSMTNGATGSHNTALGNLSLFATTGDDNTALGYSALSGLVAGSNNCSIGSGSLQSLATGTRNVVVGFTSGSSYTTTESDNILIGSSIAGTAAESHTLRIGNGTGAGSGQLNKAFISGINGTTISTPSFVTIDPTTNQLGVTSGFATWVITTASVSPMVVGTGYFCIAPGGALTLALPAAPVLGDTLKVSLDGATSWQITQSAGQQVRLGSSTTTVGVTGSLTSTAQGDSIELVARTANLWVVQYVVGTITIA